MKIENIFENNDVIIKVLRYFEVDINTLNLGLLLPQELSIYNAFKSTKRKFEFYFTRVLWQSFVINEAISYKTTGKPYLKSGHISISHSHGAVAIAYSKYKNIGMDLEMVSNKVDIIKSKYLHQKENYNSLEDLTIVWTIKEAIYKLFDVDTLFFKEHIYVQSIKKTPLVEVSFDNQIITPKVQTFKLKNQFILSYSQ